MVAHPVLAGGRPVIHDDSSSTEGVELLRRRLVVFWGSVVLLCLLGLIPTLLVGASAGSPWSTQLALPVTRAQLTATLGLGAAWAAIRFTPGSRWLLGWLDGAMAVGFCFNGALMTYFAPRVAAGFEAGQAGGSAGLLAIVSILTMRAALVPSTPVRTLVIGVAACLPLIVVSLLLQQQYPGPAAAGFVALTLTVSVLFVPLPTIITGVIYRLRREVEEAQQLGQYTLESKIGEGGMGVVYRARHALLRRPTAIKLLPPERAGGQGLARFEREVQETSRLAHPNTVAIYDYGHTSDGTFYYAMEYLDGLSLEELVEHDGPQPPGRVIHVLRQACGALAEAHAAGLVHRDIKPANLHLSHREGMPDHVKVLDFGLVKDVASNGSDPALSSVGAILGTPQYMAPESISHPEAVEAPTDLYALGGVAYFLLTGTPPFQASTLVEVCAQHLHSEPERPSLRLGRELPPALEELVLSCLAKAPAARPSSALALGRALTACAGISPWTEDDADRWWKEQAPGVVERCARRRTETPRSGEITVAVDVHQRDRRPT